MDPLNTKVVGRDGRSHASAGPASDFALSLSGRSRDLALEARLSPPEPYLWHGEELSEVRCASSLLRGSRIAGRGALGRTCLQFIVTRMPMCRDLSLFWSAIVITPVWPWCRNIVTFSCVS